MADHDPARDADEDTDEAVQEQDTSNGQPAPDDRIVAAWREWLAALATDAEAAIAAAHVYGELTPEARNAWLDVLVEDSPRLNVPPIAIYAPLLAVETDDVRRARIQQAVGELTRGPQSGTALRGVTPKGERVAALITPLYLRFVRVLWCRYQPDKGILWAQHEPLLRDDEAPQAGAQIDGVSLEATPMNPVIEELCHAILAHQRRGEELPSALRHCADLFDAQLENSQFDDLAFEDTQLDDEAIRDLLLASELLATEQDDDTRLGGTPLDPPAADDAPADDAARAASNDEEREP
ncbi:hypothetical protein [Chondromyces crocatus]|uniref:Uncharacterized protein n=1 Tax=Chondromyces crocatus TaxID=52 RepID=A0A0K1EBU2_CHOCO|nr:hypothetical protein [Chondromyces crocatus]AKT38335.1 uncharacterized protein CMC5_024800 [Chondromyces crocatus]